jgi:uncharacterized repeat protein (TIGR03803 family)
LIVIAFGSFKKSIPMNPAIRTRIKNLIFRPALMTGLGLMLAGQVKAQTFAVLHNFTGGNDGANPYAGLVLSGNILYGTAWGGGSLANGTVFSVNTNGTGFKVLHTFTGEGDGSGPYAALVLSGGTLYGTTVAGGGSANDGTVFKISTNGAGFTTLHTFTGNDGALPYGGLVLSGSTLYGTAWQGAGTSAGIVFAVSTNGTGFGILHNFTLESDGSDLQAGLLLSGGALYGTAVFGGNFDNGTVFAVDTNGTGFTNVYGFTTLNKSTNSDGAFPYAGLVQSAGTLYGTAAGGGNGASGTVFAVNTNGTGFAVLHVFTATSGPYPPTNSDGSFPMAGLMLSGNTLYGTATDGGGSGSGTVFAVNTDGTGFTVLHSFTAVTSAGANSDGGAPQAGLILSGNTLYGTAFEGGSSGYGTVFSLSLPSVNAPLVTIISSGENVILTWPPDAGFTLQSTANLVPSAVWAAVSPGPVVVNGQNTVTNVISGTQMFYRLSN